VYNHKAEAARAYRRLLETIRARFILTSYSTDGAIPLEEMLQGNVACGHVSAVMQGYKRYRVSSQRFSRKPMNVEFVLVLDTHGKSDVSVERLAADIRRREAAAIDAHPECSLDETA
jgi:adenine-specific DNA-methyltransferase